jgi:hypothetical protein
MIKPPIRMLSPVWTFRRVETLTRPGEDECGVGVGETVTPDTFNAGLDATTFGPLTSRKPYCPGLEKTNGSEAERDPDEGGVLL